MMKDSLKSLNKYAFLLFTTALFTSCVCQQKASDADLRSAVSRVSDAGDSNQRARKLVSAAYAEARRAKAEADQARLLVRKMESEASPHAQEVEQLRSMYESSIDALQQQIEQTDRLLQEQWENLQIVESQLKGATNALAASKAENESLRKDKVKLEKESDKWENKYRSITKYRWAVWSGIALVGLGIIAKFKGILY